MAEMLAPLVDWQKHSAAPQRSAWEAVVVVEMRKAETIRMKETDAVAQSPRDYYLVDVQTWEEIASVFEGNPEAALNFAMVLKTLRDSISAGRKGREVAIASLDVGIAIAFSLTQDYQAALKLFHARISGILKCEEELPRLAKDILEKKT